MSVGGAPKLTPRQREMIAVFARTGIWSYTQIGRCWGVDRRTVRDCLAKYPA